MGKYMDASNGSSIRITQSAAFEVARSGAV
jgi:hypothetical protein